MPRLCVCEYVSTCSIRDQIGRIGIILCVLFQVILFGLFIFGPLLMLTLTVAYLGELLVRWVRDRVPRTVDEAEAHDEAESNEPSNDDPDGVVCVDQRRQILGGGVDRLPGALQSPDGDGRDEVGIGDRHPDAPVLLFWHVQLENILVSYKCR